MEAANSLRRRSSLHFFYFFIFLLFILLFFMSNIPTVSAANKSRTNTYKTYIKTTCNSATYPKDCYKSLSPYASTIKTDPQKLYRVSLNITISAARKTSSSISSLWRLKGLSPTERAIVRDCADTVSDALDELQLSLTAMANLQGSSDRKSETVENLRTWVSAALTDEGTCTDEFDGQKVSNAVNKNIKKTVLNLSKMTSNCLALLNTFNC